ncbi:uncharacterized protein LOC114352565 [Ostrinia furnacalis]|uniref:uncharacterized protein LOC114352565 n=1 Tax=Ostrinia furnacalis TaxID=93504 RepID=UPI00104077D2|nr:uncharacterized protein LOC114352565 [Ostrinia furnacalis]
MSGFTVKFTVTQCDPKNYGTKLLRVMGDWQLESKDVKTRIKNLYYADTWRDCLFLFDDSERSVVAHKLVLAVASPVFAAMFFSGPETIKPMKITDVQRDTFFEMIKYIYTDTIDPKSFCDASDLYDAAKKYKLVQLQKLCIQYILRELNPEDCCSAYEFAVKYDEKELLKATENFIKTRTTEVLKSIDFLGASLSTVQYIYSLDTFAIKSELELYVALQKFAVTIGYYDSEPSGENKQISETTQKDNQVEEIKQETKENINDADAFQDCVDIKSTSEKSNPPKMENLKDKSTIEKDGKIEKVVSEFKSARVIIREILKTIRFLTIPAEEFAKISATPPLLTQSEIIAILLNIVNRPKAKLPMPEGFSIALDKRIARQVNDSRKNIKFRFTVPDCDYLKEGDEIHFPQVYGLQCSWKLTIKIKSENTYHLLLSGSGVAKYNADVRFGIMLKNTTKILYDFYSEKAEQRAIESGSLIAELDDWKTVKNVCLDDGSLTFHLTFNIKDGINDTDEDDEESDDSDDSFSFHS